MKKLYLVSLFLVAGLLAGCASGAGKKVGGLRLGMTAEQSLEVMGKPYAIRAAKQFENEEWTEVWEYIPPLFSLNPKYYWLHFENGRLVQWGQPGDFAGQAGLRVPVKEYNAEKSTR